MSLRILRIMENSYDFETAVAPAIKQKVPGSLYAITDDSMTAELQVIGAPALNDIGSTE
jgi:stage V sporulation protein SpoVS